SRCIANLSLRDGRFVFPVCCLNHSSNRSLVANGSAIWNGGTGYRNAARSFKDFVGAARQRQRDRDAERLGGLEVEEQLDLGGLLNQQIGRLVALENPPGVSADQTVVFRFTAAIAHQAAGGGKLAKFVDRGDRVADRQIGELFAVSREKVVWTDD